MQWIRLETTTFKIGSHVNPETKLILTSIFQIWAYLFGSAEIQYVNWKQSVNNIPTFIFLCNMTKNKKLRNKQNV